MTKNELKAKVCRAIDECAEKIYEIGDTILASPEMGYKEFKTAELVKNEFERLGIPYKSEIALTGVKANLRGRQSLLRVAVMGELDAIICSTHPKAVKESGAAHACGHNAQIAAMLGAAMGLCTVAKELDGDVCFFATPAEEYAEIGYREGLKENGKIELLGGKQELIRLGEFDDVDIAMMVHAEDNSPERCACLDGTSLGFVAKTINFIGKAAHAGAAPHEGINALNAATIAMSCINAQRETFRDCDSIRVHPIITNGGELVNVVPAKVTMETFVRGASFSAIRDAAEKVDRAVKGASYAIGAECEIKNFKGYLPLMQSQELGKLFENNVTALSYGTSIRRGVDLGGSTDTGDLSHLIPTIHPTMGGYTGVGHSVEFGIVDREFAYLAPAKAMAMTVIDLLADGAVEAKRIKDSFTPAMTKEEYLKF